MCQKILKNHSHRFEICLVNLTLNLKRSPYRFEIYILSKFQIHVGNFFKFYDALRIDWLPTHIPRILGKYQACLEKSFLYEFVWLVNQSQNRIQNPAFWLVGQPQIRGGNFSMIGHMTRLIPCKDSNLNYRTVSRRRTIFMVYNYLSTYIELFVWNISKYLDKITTSLDLFVTY